MRRMTSIDYFVQIVLVTKGFFFFFGLVTAKGLFFDPDPTVGPLNMNKVAIVSLTYGPPSEDV